MSDSWHYQMRYTVHRTPYMHLYFIYLNVIMQSYFSACFAVCFVAGQ